MELIDSEAPRCLSYQYSMYQPELIEDYASEPVRMLA